MEPKDKIVVFESKQVRRVWHNEEWWFAVVDVIEVLTESSNPSVYWRVLKKRLLDEGSDQTVTKCNGLKLKAADGKMRVTDCANTETLFRIIQSIPSPKAEPFKQWLAKVGYERIQEIENPELAAIHAREYYQALGYSEAARKGGSSAGKALEAFEQSSGRNVVASTDFKGQIKEAKKQKKTLGKIEDEGKGEEKV